MGILRTIALSNDTPYFHFEEDGMIRIELDGKKVDELECDLMPVSRNGLFISTESLGIGDKLISFGMQKVTGCYRYGDDKYVTLDSVTRYGQSVLKIA